VVVDRGAGETFFPTSEEAAWTRERAGGGGELWAAADLVTPMAIRVAATLRWADHIAAGRRTAEELGASFDALMGGRLGADAPVLAAAYPWGTLGHVVDVGGYVLSGVLHDWNDGDAVRILTRCAEAASEGGRVFVIEDAVGDGRGTRTPPATCACSATSGAATAPSISSADSPGAPAWSSARSPRPAPARSSSCASGPDGSAVG
jgi:hypothetical protein